MSHVIGGSSPHTRGTRASPRTACRTARDHPRIRGEHVHGERRHDVADGIIPAYAGNTVHGQRLALACWGSSPHTRGTPITSRSFGTRDGIIPAYAGNTAVEPSSFSAPKGSSPHTRGTPTCCARRSLGRWDHPRIRGEHFKSRCFNQFSLGIIPAYAGNTTETDTLGAFAQGSSPHTRGTPRCTVSPWPLTRIIPAYAGNTEEMRAP